jgi:hypothetical protein
VALGVDDRDAALRVLAECPDGLLELRATLLQQWCGDNKKGSRGAGASPSTLTQGERLRTRVLGRSAGAGQAAKTVFAGLWSRNSPRLADRARLRQFLVVGAIQPEWRERDEFVCDCPEVGSF